MVGDVVVTSGIDGIYPKGFVIGRIDSVERGGGAYQHDPGPADRGLHQPGGGAGPDPAAGPRRGPDGRPRAAPVGPAAAAGAPRRGLRHCALALRRCQTTLAQLLARGTAALDLVLVVVVYVGLTVGPISGLVAGTVAGLVQDALGSGILGIGGLAKTVVGYLAGVVGTQFIVAASVPRFVVFALATAVHAALFMGPTCCSTCGRSRPRGRPSSPRPSATASSACWRRSSSTGGRGSWNGGGRFAPIG